MSRAEFTKLTKAQAFQRAGGRCECGCGSKPTPGEIEYDHRIPAAVGGTNDLSNCVVMRKKCHRRKTSTKDVPEISKSVRVSEKAMGLRKSSRPMAKRNDPWGKERRQ